MTRDDGQPRRVAWPAAGAEQSELVEQAATLLRGGAVVALPTDTVYGLAAHPERETAMDALYALKGRPREKAIALLVARPEAIDELATDVPPGARALAERYWPGGLTLVLRSRRDPTTTVALRMPDHPVPLRIIEAVGSPLATTSANRSAATSPRSADNVLAQLPSGYPLLIDSGPAARGIDSTVLDLTSTPPRILRAGAIHREHLAQIIGLVEGG